ncbi:MAG: sigma-54 interaction domain-containing protein [Bryobacteraceae bacterium]
MIEPALIELLMRVVDPAQRREGSRSLASYLGVDDLICFVRDAETGALLPVQGFPQTLPREWRTFLRATSETRTHEGELPVLGDSGTAIALGVEYGDGNAFVLLGGAGRRERVEATRALLPLLAPTFASEMSLRSATAQVDIERQAAQEAGEITSSLSAAQRNLERLAGREAALRREAQEVMRHIFEGTAADTGQRFFSSLVEHLASAGRVRYAFVTECRNGRKRARMLAFWNGKVSTNSTEYDVAGTPCESVYEGKISHHEQGVQQLFPTDRDLVDLGAESYLGLPMFGGSGEVIGHLVALDDKPMAEDPQRLEVLKIFAARAGAELERHHSEQLLREALRENEALRRQLQDENRYLRQEIQSSHDVDSIVGSSPEWKEILDHVDRVAPLDSTVLIMGETGTGKELVARAVHSRSRRRERPLVKVNCGAIPTGLIESELFGHVKGAFTGASDKRTGRFELANGGTIFLDEVGELPLDMQVKLLRALQEQEFEPVGSSRTVKVDVRVIAATNRDLALEVEAGRFRRDLFYRLNVFPIVLPPLRERTGDIRLLAHFFLDRFAAQSGKRFSGIEPATLERLVSYSWPGNIRELQNVIERAVILCGSASLTIDPMIFQSGRAVPISSGAPAAPRATAPRERSASAPSGGADRVLDSLDDMGRAHIKAALESTNWQIEGDRGAAKILGLHPNTLRSRMKKLGIARPLVAG